MKDDINNFVENISKKYSVKYNLNYDDLCQDLFLEYYTLIKKPSFLSRKAEPDFDEPAYIYTSLKNRCLRIASKEFELRRNVPCYLDTTDEDYIEGICSNYVLEKCGIIDFIDTVHDALDVLDEQSRKYVITLGYLKANLLFLEKDFNEITKECTEEELDILSMKPTDKNIAKYIMKSNPRHIKYLRNKLRKNQKFVNILKKN